MARVSGRDSVPAPRAGCTFPGNGRSSGPWLEVVVPGTPEPVGDPEEGLSRSSAASRDHPGGRRRRNLRAYRPGGSSSWLVAPVFLAMVIVAPGASPARLAPSASRPVGARPAAPAGGDLRTDRRGSWCRRRVVGPAGDPVTHLRRRTWASSSRISRPDLPSSASAPIRLGP